MKRFLKAGILTSAILCVGVSGIRSEEKPKYTPPKDIEIVQKDLSKGIPTRPKAPSRQSIDCTYYDGTLSVAFLIPEGECTMTITDNETGMSLQYIFSTEEVAEIYVGPLDSAYIEFDTENGNSYEGWLN